MPTGYRETVIRFQRVEKVVRTVQTGTVERLERDHTRNVKAAIHALCISVIDADEASDTADTQAREWVDSPGFPGSGARIKASYAKNSARIYSERRAAVKFTTPKGNWDDARKGWPPVKYNIAVTDPRVRDCHERIDPIPA